MARIKNLEILINYLEKLKEKFPIEYEILTDATLRYRIDLKEKLESYYKTGKIIQCPSGVKADYFIIDYFNRYPEETIIISNDNFSDYEKTNLTICKFVIIFDEIIFKPDLNEILDLKVETLQDENANVKAV